MKLFGIIALLCITANSLFAEGRLKSATEIDVIAKKNESAIEGFALVQVELYDLDYETPLFGQDLWFMDNSYQIHVTLDVDGKCTVYMPTGIKEMYTETFDTQSKFSLKLVDLHQDSTYLIKGVVSLKELGFKNVEPPTTIMVEPDIMVEKPIIYLYSEEDSTDVDISIYTKSDIQFVYPTAQEKVGQKELHYTLKLNKNGTILSDNKEYPYLFWDGRMPMFERFDEGFIVAKDSVISFLETTLSKMGMNEREQTDFITYWAPRMQKRDKVCMKFRFGADYDEFISTNKYSIKPDSELRVFMSFTYAIPTNDSFIPYQEIPVFKRKGLTVVEWGGAEISLIQRPVGVRLK